jgi:endonuclease/exonuclease/phosphatase family metal-dependent hydrolase
MKRFFLFPVLLIFILGFQAFPAKLKIMTFNIRYDNPDDGIYSWQNRKKLVFSLLRKESPDIIGFQEVLKSQVADLSGELTGYGWSGVGRDDGKELGEYSAVFYRKDRFERVDGSTFWLSETPEVPGSRSWNAACNRIVTWVKLKDRITGDVLFVFNTHFDHISETARKESAKLLRDRVGQIAGNGIALITGDFNDTQGSATYSYLVSGTGSFLDTRSTAAVISGPDYSFIGFPFKPDTGNLIDFIFTRNLEPDRILSYKVLTFNKRGRYPSDHLPVEAIVETTETSKR